MHSYAYNTSTHTVYIQHPLYTSKNGENKISTNKTMSSTVCLVPCMKTDKVFPHNLPCWKDLEKRYDCVTVFYSDQSTQNSSTVLCTFSVDQGESTENMQKKYKG
jgi:hypothetical protein